MAMNITKSTSYGVDATYWRIVGGTIDYASLSLVIHVEGYISQAAREAGSKPVGSWSVSFTGEDFVPVAEPTRAAIYAKLLMMPDWQGATEI